ncbi:hypothetical protein, partial [Acinetobacter baumannii]|uniref:hypothetical protein n=1 Tax=Acinetobacter baumannii TaxID=470 RepID=UPI001C0791E9
SSKWEGPFKIIEKLSEANYKIKKLNSTKVSSIVHFDRLRPCYSRTETEPESELDRNSELEENAEVQELDRNSELEETAERQELDRNSEGNELNENADVHVSDK